ncbi:single-stranded-DNA-specific exonuclease RecJ [Aneurinibacillus uraniidurans]|uniref:single-stranded-DNA-specific exonuclease RecJ n=1 Tax=Aneurinibacillus uraniidurans TaxID=2966586 RepID=UPI0023491564|nr:single-stranded-DNA-specific exonuclease RecJ [Aneurinibacillus sp. B1]WCN38599.1 single-stranded-DNA-specific exonuclease RecJ [Aneurinibacillus sp. B1]
MLKSKTRWKMKATDEVAVQTLAQTLRISPLLAHLLVGRGIDTSEKAERFLGGNEGDLYDPFLLDDMEKAITRVREAIDSGEPILIYGDYDADGVTSTSIMIHTLRMAGAVFQYYIPNRFTEGYGLNEEALVKAAENGFGVVVTVDTGISAVKEAETAKELGIDLIITDHHEPPAIIPDAYAVINPKKPGCPYPFDMLAGAGVAFKFAHALLGEIPHHLLEIAAIGTIADLVPLVDENRLIARLGLQALDRSVNPGVQALKKVCSIEGKVSAYHIGFGMGPRINATGRLETADRAVKMFITNKLEEAELYAQELDELNKERQELVETITAEAEQLVLAMPDEQTNVIVVAKEGWNEGVIGIVASRLVERFYRPTIVLSINREHNKAKGSARSIAGFNMYEALTECADILPHYGGHPMAAGMTLAEENVDVLRSRLNALAKEWLTDEDYIPITAVDAVCTLAEANLETIEQIERMAPFGIGNPSPRIVMEGVEISDLRIIGKDENHIKCQFRQDGVKLDGIGFKMADIVPELPTQGEVNVVGELSVNEWNHTRRPQFILKDISVPGMQIFDWRGARNKEEKLRLLGETGQMVRVVAFRERNQQALTRILSAFPNLMADGDGHTQVVLYDLPVSREELAAVLASYPDVDRLYCLFGEEPTSLPSIPTNEQFKDVYKTVYQHKTVAYADVKNLAQAKKLTPSAAQFILSVFTELSFLEDTGREYRFVANPAKKELIVSELYRQQQAALEIETELLYSSYQSLCVFLRLHMGDRTQKKEIATYGL